MNILKKSKVESYLGFSKKAGKLTLGSGAIECVRGGVCLVIFDGNAAKNTKRMAQKFKNRFNCPLVRCESGFEEAVAEVGCKIAAVRDRQLAKAILENLDDTFKLCESADQE